MRIIPLTTELKPVSTSMDVSMVVCNVIVFNIKKWLVLISVSDIEYVRMNTMQKREMSNVQSWHENGKIIYLGDRVLLLLTILFSWCVFLILPVCKEHYSGIDRHFWLGMREAQPFFSHNHWIISKKKLICFLTIPFPWKWSSLVILEFCRNCHEGVV